MHHTQIHECLQAFKITVAPNHPFKLPIRFSKTRIFNVQYASQTVAKDNLQAITDNFTIEDNGVELPIPEADSANEETQMNDPGTPGKVELPDINQGSNL